MNQMTIKKPNQLRRELAEVGMAQTEFARHIGVNERTVRNWIGGRSPIPKRVGIILGMMKELERRRIEAEEAAKLKRRK